MAQRPSQRQRTRGAVSLLFALFMLLLVGVAVSAALRLSGAGLQDTLAHESQAAALYLAESGIERAHALQSQAAASGSFAASCQALAGTGPFSLGRGRFSYTAASHQASTCPGTSATGLLGACCTFTVAAELGESRRVVQAQIETTDPNGVAGRASTTQYLNLQTTVSHTAIVTNLAYRAKDSGGSNAVVQACAHLGSDSLGGCLTQWDLDSGGTYSVNGMGVFAAIPAPATFKIQTSFRTSSLPAVRQYVLTGGLFPPVDPAVPVSLRSAYSQGPTGALSSRTVGSGSASVNVPNHWCLGSATAASQADTLALGFSSMPGTPSGGTPVFMDELTLGDALSPQAGFSRLLLMRGLKDNSIRSGHDHYLYSQMWTLHNPAYTMDSGVTASSSGAQLTLTPAPVTPIRKGTVLAVPNAAAVLAPVASRARVAADALLVPAGASLPAPGDAVYGPHVVSGTFISGAGVAQADGSWRFPVSPAQVASEAEKRVFFRAAVLADSSTASISLSRAPSTPLAGARLCGGLCALFQANGSGTPNANLHLIGVTAGDEWSMGMTCLSGVRAEGIDIISGPPLRRVAWNEVLQ